MSSTMSSSSKPSDDVEEKKEKQDKGLPKDPNDWDTAVCVLESKEGLGQIFEIFYRCEYRRPSVVAFNSY